MTINTVLVTGASGFIGKTLCSDLLRRGYSVHATTSDQNKMNPLNAYLTEQMKTQRYSDASGKAEHQNANALQTVDTVVIPAPLSTSTSWEAACQGVDVIIHLAGRAHILRENSKDPMSAFQEFNRDATVALAEAAVKCRVKRVVYVSSIGVNGNSTSGRRMCETDIPHPHDPYTQSKYQAEQALHSLSKQSHLEVVIVRPPLVYGPGAKGNFPRLLKLVKLGFPLPLSGVKNARSLIGIENLTDALILCAIHPAAAGNVFLVSDGVEMSTAELIGRIARYMGRSPRLFPLPLSLLKLVGRITRQSSAIDRLCNSLEIDSRKIQDYLDWTPPQSPDEGLKKAVKWYMSHKDAL